jgi:hypothetical protein
MRRLTVLGSCGARPEAGRACSGFLLEFDGLKIGLDLGFGTFSRLLTHAGTGAVDAVIITHSHSDHCVDLHALFRERRNTRDAPLVPLYCPPDVVDRVEPLEPDARLTDAFTVHELPGSHRIGPLRCDGVLLTHHVPNTGIRLSAPGFTLALHRRHRTGRRPGRAGRRRRPVHRGRHVPGPAHRPTHPDDGTGSRCRGGRGGRETVAADALLARQRPLSVAQAAEHFDGEILAASEDLVIDL